MVRLLTELLKIASALIGYLERRSLVEQGKALKTQELMAGWIDAIERAKRARDRVAHDDDSVQRDNNNRDRW